MTTYTAVYPRLVVGDAAAAIELYAKVFDAEELERHTADGTPTGKIHHAMLRIGGVQVAVKDEDEHDRSPKTLAARPAPSGSREGTERRTAGERSETVRYCSPVIMAVEVADADAVGARLTEAGGTVVYPIQDWDYGQRGGRFADPWGHLWMVAQNL